MLTVSDWYLDSGSMKLKSYRKVSCCWGIFFKINAIRATDNQLTALLE